MPCCNGRGWNGRRRPRPGLSMPCGWRRCCAITASAVMARRGRRRGCGWTVLPPLMRGSRHGAVVQPGDARHSELFDRISLPPSDDKAMPPSGKTPLTDDEVTVIRLWIAAGASGTHQDDQGRAKTGAAGDHSRKAIRRWWQKQRAPLAAAVRQLQQRFPGVIDYESRSSADLEIDASLTGTRFGDAELGAAGAACRAASCGRISPAPPSPMPPRPCWPP